MCLVLVGCGGEAATAVINAPSSPDRQAPVIEVQELWRNESGQVLVEQDPEGYPALTVAVVKARDDIDVTAYCFTPDAIRPSARSDCFASANSKQVRVGPAWHAWVRDAAGNVSAGRISPGPCSEQAYIASESTPLPTVCMMTDQGEVVLALEQEKAPNTVKNFLSYVQEGFYSGTVFHRVLSGSVVQGGGFTRLSDVPSNTTKTASRAPIALERTSTTGLSNIERTIVMARTNEPDSATTQFFINLRDNSSDYDAKDNRDGYAVFGQVIHGYEATVRPIASVPLGGTRGDLPQQAIYLQWAYLMK